LFAFVVAHLKETGIRLSCQFIVQFKCDVLNFCVCASQNGTKNYKSELLANVFVIHDTFIILHRKLPIVLYFIQHIFLFMWGRVGVRYIM
jgi:hypothetical protein